MFLYGIITSHLFGFLEDLSAADDMQKLTFKIVEKCIKENKCIGAFMDLAKAFDTLPYCKLLDVLQHYGIRGIVLKLLQKYLTDMTKINKIAVTQKSALEFLKVIGPMLFITLINGLSSLETGGSILC